VATVAFSAVTYVCKSANCCGLPSARTLIANAASANSASINCFFLTLCIPLPLCTLGKILWMLFAVDELNRSKSILCHALNYVHRAQRKGIRLVQSFQIDAITIHWSSSLRFGPIISIATMLQGK
jgi:hypothetical protein